MGKKEKKRNVSTASLDEEILMVTNDAEAEPPVLIEEGTDGEKVENPEDESITVQDSLPKKKEDQKSSWLRKVSIGGFVALCFLLAYASYQVYSLKTLLPSMNERISLVGEQSASMKNEGKDLKKIIEKLSTDVIRLTTQVSVSGKEIQQISNQLKNFQEQISLLQSMKNVSADNDTPLSANNDVLVSDEESTDDATTPDNESMTDEVTTNSFFTSKNSTEEENVYFHADYKEGFSNVRALIKKSISILTEWVRLGIQRVRDTIHNQLSRRQSYSEP